MSRQPDWERLQKLGFELEEDRRHIVMKLSDRLFDSLPMKWRPFLECYIEAEAVLHWHIRQKDATTTSGLDAPHLCVTFEWPRGTRLRDDERDFWVSRNDFFEFNEEMRQVKVAMLVDVPEFIQNRERLFGRILPVSKRLQRLEDCAKTWVDSPEAVRWLLAPRDEFTGFIQGVGEKVDGESNIPPLATRSPSGDRIGWRLRLVGDSKRPDQMVERRAEVVNNVPDDLPPIP